MTNTIRFYATVVILLMTAAPSHAGPCQRSIDRVQAQVDAVIEKRAASGPWAPESVDARRNYQPTPRSLAKAEVALGTGAGLESALNALGRARDADRAADVALCNSALNDARRAIGVRPQ
jgi:hypothetical protein